MPGANPSLEDRFYNARRFLPEFIGGRSWEPADIGNDAVKQMIGRKGFRKGWSPAHERQWQSDHAFSDKPIETQQLMKDVGVTDYVGAPVASPYTGIMSDDKSHPQFQPYGSQQQPQMNPAFSQLHPGFTPPHSGNTGFPKGVLGAARSVMDFDPRRFEPPIGAGSQDNPFWN